MWRTWLTWIAALTVPILLIRWLSDAPSDRNEIPYSVFAEQMERGNLARVEITPNEPQLVGAFSRPVDLDSVTVTEFRVVLPFQNADDLVARMEAQHIPISARSPGPSWTSIVLPMLPWLLLIGFWIFLLRRMQSGGQQALAFGRSGAKLLTPDVPKLTFADVAGADEAKQELQELIDFLRDPDRFRRLGGRLPKGVLLVGPPGTGKTLLARAVAGEAGCAFLSISGSDFVEMFVGVGASRVRDLFRQGKAYAPAIIFIDELDAVGRQRGAGLGGGHDEREQTLNQLLVELDGFEPKEGVILLSATNRPDVLDPALLRPGRFDRRIVVDLPDLKAREQILEVHARKIVLGEDVDLASIARGTPGMSGADLANIANEAALFAARRHREYVGQREFEDAKDKVMLGVERRSLVLTPEERRLAAYHEAGHTLVNLLIPGLDPVYKVTIVPRDRAMGATFSLPEVDRRSYTRAFLMGRLAVAYGGRIAEELTFGPEDVTTGAAQDFQQATDMARRMVTQFGMSDVLGPVAVGGSTEEVFLGRELVHGRDVSNRTADMIDQEVRRLVTAAYTRARELLGSHRNTLDALAAALLERETLDADDVRRIFTETVDAPPTDAVVTETAV